MNKLSCLIIAIPGIILFGVSYWKMMNMIFIKENVDEHIQKLITWLLICIASISWCGAWGTISGKLLLL